MSELEIYQELHSNSSFPDCALVVHVSVSGGTPTDEASISLIYQKSNIEIKTQ